MLEVVVTSLGLQGNKPKCFLSFQDFLNTVSPPILKVLCGVLLCYIHRLFFLLLAWCCQSGFLLMSHCDLLFTYVMGVTRANLRVGEASRAAMHAVAVVQIRTPKRAICPTQNPRGATRCHAPTKFLVAPRSPAMPRDAPRSPRCPAMPRTPRSV